MSRLTVVFLPGLLCDEHLFSSQAEALGDIAVPLIADLTQDDSIAAMARRVLAVAPASFALAGLSMGGYVALEVMRQAPQRVTRLALLDTRAGPDDEGRARQRRLGIAAAQLGRFAGVTDRLLPRLIHPSHVAGPVGEAVKAMAVRVGPSAFLRQQCAILARPDARPLLATIRVPTLVAVGDGDLMTPPVHSEELHRGIAGSQLHVFQGCGHLPPLEKREETNALLRGWLSSHPPRGGAHERRRAAGGHLAF